MFYNIELLGSSDPDNKIYRAEKERLFTGFRIFAWLYRRIGSLPLDLVESLFFICKGEQNKMVKENSYINIQAFMVNDLHLKGNELLIYAIIWGFSQDGVSEYTGGLQYLADWTNSTQQGVLKALKKLLEKQLLLKSERRNGIIKYCTYKVTQYETKFNGESRLNKVESPIKQSLITDETKFNGAIKQSLSNNLSDNINDKLENNIKGKQKRFVKPSVSEIQEYCNERQNRINAEQFYNYYESKGWYVGKNKMVDWKACVRTWEQNEKKYTSQNGGYVNSKRPASDSVVGEIDF